MTWDGIVTKYHKSHIKRLEIPMNVAAYIQSIVLKKTVETISFRASMYVIMRSEMHEEPTEDGVKKRKNIILLISEEGTALMKPTNSINEESDWEEETEVIKEQKKTCKKW
ncbi:hypothetical protein CWI36_0912p0010 [Hamiltosporidium magnivora]|uniref:Uncharacterized protein n=1 Tax=Hamiltosporidium magnivora TaxID=148818 RepID=A0A4V2JVC5_9MICR|nr:hypothetical protein CWI36_0912p0010 [Hamiltosporidium magnivora]